LKLNFFLARQSEKAAILLFILFDIIQLEDRGNQQTIIFAATRHHVEYLAELCKAANLPTTFIYGAMN